MLGYILTERLHIQRLVKRALMKHDFGVLLIIIPWGFVSYLAKLEVHFPEFLSLCGPGLGLAMKEVLCEVWKMEWRGHLVSKEGGVKVRCYCTHPGCWVCQSCGWHGPAAGPMASSLPLALPSASLKPGSGSQVDPQQVTCTSGFVGREMARDQHGFLWEPDTHSGSSPWLQNVLLAPFWPYPCHIMSVFILQWLSLLTSGPDTGQQTSTDS